MVQAKIVRQLACGLAISLLMLPGMAAAHGGGEKTTVITGGYKVSLDFEEPAKIGGVPVHVKILNAMGQPVSDAQVIVSASALEQAQGSMDSGAAAMGGMHNMAGMEGMAGMHDMAGTNAVATVTLSNELHRKAGDYIGVITVPAAGHWLLNAHFSVDGRMLNADFPVEIAGDYSTSYAILAGFAGLNALIIWAAAVAKRNPVVPEPIEIIYEL